MTRIAITGASGFLGRAVLAELERMSVPATALSRKPRQDTRTVHWVQGDVTDRDDIDGLVPEGGVVIHAGATLQGSSREVLESIITGTRNVLAAARDRHTRVVHISSLSVIAPDALRTGFRLDESAPVDPRPEARGPYTRAKILAERLVEEHRQSGGGATVVRPAQLVGPGMESVPPSVARRLGPVLLMLGEPSGTIPVVHVADAASGVAMVIDHDNLELVHLVDRRSVTKAELHHSLRGSSVPHSTAPLLRVASLARTAGLLMPAIRRRLDAIDARATWTPELAISLGWSPRHLDGWLESPFPA